VDARRDKKGRELARLAGQLCQQERFQEACGTKDPDEAADFIRRICGVESRAELDHDPVAAAKFHAQVRIPYLKGQRLI
jgi:hypothetical protein